MDMDRPFPSLPFDNTYARLPDKFYQRLSPTPVAAPRLIRLNVPLAEQIGLDPAWLASPDGLAMLPPALRARLQVTQQCRPEDIDRKSTRLNSSHMSESRMPSSA